MNSTGFYLTDTRVSCTMNLYSFYGVCLNAVVQRQGWERNSMAKAKTNALRISYDKASDVLYLAFGMPQTGIDKEISAGYLCV